MGLPGLSKTLTLSFEPGSSGPKPDRIDQATPQPPVRLEGGEGLFINVSIDGV